jgi:UPF0042 nucleotide-binding protein
MNPSVTTTTAPRFVIVTGLSGAGKTQAIRYFEDLGFFCVDNLPPALITKFAELCAHSGGRVGRVAVVTDARGGAFFDDLLASLDELKGMGVGYQILFLEASDEALVNRYKETRRPHPLASGDHSLLESIQEERARLDEIRGRADKVIDTSALPPRELRDEIAKLFGAEAGTAMSISITSFGFKYGLPLDADLVFDVRFLANPHYQPELRPLPGTDRAVEEFVLHSEGTHAFLERLYALIDFALPRYTSEGKAYLSIAIGCTGGRHRSVVLARQLAQHLRSKGYRAIVEHRDLRK